MYTILEYVEDRYDCLRWELYRMYNIDTKEDAFLRMYNERKSGRYDNHRRYIFGDGVVQGVAYNREFKQLEDKQLAEEYKEWEKSYNTIEHFYGSCVYD